MNLWVRSQDKECLTNISNIQYVYKNYMHGLGTYYNNLKILGTYKTKERALEVLDEIQNKLNIRHCNDAGIQFILINEMTPIIYEMPKE